MISRRQFLILAGTVTLAGCGGSTPAPISAASAQASGSAQAPRSASASAAAPASAAAKPAPPASSSATLSGPTTLKVGYNTVAGSMWPLWMADAIHAFADYKLKVSLQFVAAAASVAALMGRDIDLLQAGGPPVLTAGLGGADVVFVASALNRAIIALYANNSIKTAADLKGKTLASDKPGSPLDYAMGIALTKLGLKRTDVKIVPLSSDAVVAAMFANEVQSGMVAPPQSFQVEARGYHLLQDTFDIPYQNTCIVATKSHLVQLAPTMPTFLAAYRQGIIALKAQPDLAMKVLEQYTKESDQTILKKTYDFYLGRTPFDASLQPNVQGIKGMLQYFAESVPAAKTATPEQFIDARFIAPALALPKPA